MRISRIYIDTEMQENSLITIEGQPAHYLSKVLRLSPQSPVVLFNGKGGEFVGNIFTITKKQVQVTLHSKRMPHVESSLQTILGLGISRGERMDYAIQKCTELGVSELFPLFSEHCEVKLQGERLKKRTSHWQQIAISACEQSGRCIVPRIHPPMPLENWIDSVTSTTRFIFDHTQEQALNETEPDSDLTLLVGPEGGFSDKELNLARKLGFQGIKLGPRVMRTETAAASALTVLQYLYGDLL